MAYPPDPRRFTRKGTSEESLIHFNQWMQAQPWWQDVARSRRSGGGDFSERERRAIEQRLASLGAALPKDFHIDEGGNVNQTSRVKSRILKGAALGGAALTGFGLAGLGPLAGLGGAAGAGGAAGTAPLSLGAVEGGAFGLPASAASMLPGFSAVPASLGGGVSALGAAGGLGGAASAGRKWLGPLVRGGAMAGLSGIGQARQGGGGDASPELSRLLQQQQERQQAMNPLYESILQLAFNRLPTSATAGLEAPSFASAESATPPLQAGERDEPLELRQLLRNTEVRQRMSDPLVQAISALAGSRLPGMRTA